MTFRPSLLLVAPIRVYQKILRPALPPLCRFEPTCSEYAAEAIERHGILRGSAMALGRLARCHPFCDGGIDPVPPSEKRL